MRRCHSAYEWLSLCCLLPPTAGLFLAAAALLWQRPPYARTNLLFHVCFVFVFAMHAFSHFHFLPLRWRSSSLRSLTTVLCSLLACNCKPTLVTVANFVFNFQFSLFTVYNFNFFFCFLHFESRLVFAVVAVAQCCLIYDWWRVYKRQKNKFCSRLIFIVAVCFQIYIFRSKVQVQSEWNEKRAKQEIIENILRCAFMTSICCCVDGYN